MAQHPVGALLQYWRKTRNLSQLALSIEAEVSARHLCFIETGRAKPSREMVLLLASVLEVPLRERNALLLAAGYAPVYAESKLDAPELSAVTRALDAILKQQLPYPAVVMNRHWDLMRANFAAEQFFGFLLEGVPGRGSSNVLRMMFDPGLVRPFVRNWDQVAEMLVRRVHRECVGAVFDEATHKLLSEVLGYPGVPAALRRPDPGAALLPVVPLVFEKSGRRFSFFSTVTTLGTPQDVTVQELRIECFFPADESTEAEARRSLAAAN